MSDDHFKVDAVMYLIDLPNHDLEGNHSQIEVHGSMDQQSILRVLGPMPLQQRCAMAGEI